MDEYDRPRMRFAGCRSVGVQPLPELFFGQRIDAGQGHLAVDAEHHPLQDVAAQRSDTVRLRHVHEAATVVHPDGASRPGVSVRRIGRIPGRSIGREPDGIPVDFLRDAVLAVVRNAPVTAERVDGVVLLEAGEREERFGIGGRGLDDPLGPLGQVRMVEEVRDAEQLELDLPDYGFDGEGVRQWPKPGAQRRVDGRSTVERVRGPESGERLARRRPRRRRGRELCRLEQ